MVLFTKKGVSVVAAVLFVVVATSCGHGITSGVAVTATEEQQQSPPRALKLKFSKKQSPATSRPPTPGPTSPPEPVTTRGLYLAQADQDLMNLEFLICGRDEYAQNCARITEGLDAGSRRNYVELPKNYFLNYRAMNIAYNMLPQTDAMVPIFLKVLRIHRALGLGNTQRLLGTYTDEQVDASYWNYDTLLALQDTPYTVALAAQPVNGDGITGLCKLLAKEYEALKALGVEYHNATYFESVSPTFNTPSILLSPFYLMCIGPNPFSYMVRNDWEHHRRECVGALMQTKYAATIVTYTIWHWESLFAMQAAPEQVIPQLFLSFDALLATFAE